PDTAAGDVELLGGAGTRPERNTNVEDERRPHEQHVDCKLAHYVLLLETELLIEFVHLPAIEEDQRDEDVDGTLLSEEEAKIGAADHDSGQHGTQDDAKTVRA